MDFSTDFSLIDDGDELYGQVSDYLSYKEKLNRAHVPFIVHFDSRERDVSKDLFASNFLKNFTNDIKRIGEIELQSLEFTNTSFTISRTIDAQVSWINENESDIDFPVYTATIHLGVYTINSITTEMIQTMNKVPRQKQINGKSLLHSWRVVIEDAPVNTISFYNVIYSNQGINTDPISVTSDSNEAVIQQISHGHSPGDTILLNNVDGNPGGIPNNYFTENSFIVSRIIDADKFCIQITVTPYITMNSGGNNVSVGISSRYKFVSNPSDTTNTTTTTNTANDTNNTNDSSNTNPNKMKMMLKRPLLSILGFPPQSVVLCTDQFTVENLIDCLKNSFEIQNDLLLETSSSIFQSYTVGTVFSMYGAENINIGSEDRFQIQKFDIENGSVVCIIAFLNGKSFIDLNSLKKPTSTQNKKIAIFSDTNNGNIGMNIVQSNRLDSGSLYQSIDLSGDAYCYLTSPQLQSAIPQIGTPLQTKILSKIQLTTSPGYLDFNKYLPIKVEWEKEKSIDLSSIRLQLMNADGYILDMEGLDYSGTLKFTQRAPKKPSFLIK